MPAASQSAASCLHGQNIAEAVGVKCLSVSINRKLIAKTVLVLLKQDSSPLGVDCVVTRAWSQRRGCALLNLSAVEKREAR